MADQSLMPGAAPRRTETESRVCSARACSEGTLSLLRTPFTGQLAARLREAGYKLTLARQAVLQVLETAEEHLNYADVLTRGQAIYPALGRATVYRTLELLTNLGIVRPIYLSEGGTHFTRADCAHHHLLCSDCGVVIEFDDCVIAELEQILSQRLDFRIKGHLLEFYGLCINCRE